MRINFGLILKEGGEGLLWWIRRGIRRRDKRKRMVCRWG